MQTSTPRTSITATCTAIATIAAGLGTVAVGLGILIESTFASALGAPMPISSAVRHGLVGLAFLIYSIIPIAVLSVPIWLVKVALPAKQETFLFSAWLYLAVCYAIMIVGSISLHYYFALGDRARLPFGPFNLVATHYCYLPTSWITWIAFWLPTSALIGIAVAKPKMLGRMKRLMPIISICIFFGMLSLPVPYSVGVYPNIRRDIGGGAPVFAAIGTEARGDILEYLRRHSAGLGDVDSDLGYGPLLVWHAGDKVVCSSVAKNIFGLRFVSLNAEDIDVISPLPFDLFVRRGYEVIIYPRFSGIHQGLSDLQIELDEWNADWRDSKKEYENVLEEAREYLRNSRENKSQ